MIRRLPRPQHSDSKGFTLVELLLVVGLIALSLGVTSDILLTLIRSYNKTQVTHEIEQQANFVSLKIEKELRDADSASVVNGDLLISTPNGGVTYHVDIDNSDPANPIGTVERTDSDGTLPLTESSQLSGISVACNDPSGFCFIETSSDPVIIRLDFDFTKANTGGLTPFDATLDVDNTIVIRNSYSAN